MKLKSIEQETADCRAALADSKVGDPVNFCHHEVPLEFLREPAENRIEYILSEKTDNVALRLRLFRPAKMPENDTEFDKARAEYHKARAKYNKAWVECGNARDEYRKAWAEYDKAQDEYNKAWAEYDKAQDEYYKALDEYKKAYLVHFKELFGVEWKGSIFKTFEEVYEL